MMRGFLSNPLVCVQHKVWLRPSAEQQFLYGQHALKSGLARMSDTAPRLGGVCVCNQNDLPLVCALRCTLYNIITYCTSTSSALMLSEAYNCTRIGYSYSMPMAGVRRVRALCARATSCRPSRGCRLQSGRHRRVPAPRTDSILMRIE